MKGRLDSVPTLETLGRELNRFEVSMRGNGWMYVIFAVSSICAIFGATMAVLGRPPFVIGFCVILLFFPFFLIKGD